MYVETRTGEHVEVLGLPMHADVVGKFLTVEAEVADESELQKQKGSKKADPVRLFGSKYVCPTSDDLMLSSFVGPHTVELAPMYACRPIPEGIHVSIGFAPSFVAWQGPCGEAGW